MNSPNPYRRWQILSALREGNAEDANLKQAADALLEFAQESVASRRQLSMIGVRGSPDWQLYETELWQLSEEIRELVKRDHRLRGRNPLLDMLARIAADPRFGKGRQNMILVLGELGRGEYAATLGRLLDDPEVYGHAIKALQQGRVVGYADRVSTILKYEKRAWIRASARKYLSRFNSNS